MHVLNDMSFIAMWLNFLVSNVSFISRFFSLLSYAKVATSLNKKLWLVVLWWFKSGSIRIPTMSAVEIFSIFDLTLSRGMISNCQIVLDVKASAAWVIDDLESESHLGFLLLGPGSIDFWEYQITTEKKEIFWSSFFDQS